MKRIVWIVAIVAIVVGAGYGAMRFLGDSAIERRLEVAKAEALARGWALTVGGQTAEGFPVANRVHLTDVALVSTGGVLIKAANVIVAEDPAAAGALSLRFAGDIDVTVPISQSMRQSNNLLPAKISVTVTSEDMLLRVGAGETGDLTAILTAGALRAALDQTDFPVKISIDAGALSLDSDQTDKGRRIRLKADRFALDLRDTSGNGTSVLDSRYAGLSIGATVRAKTVEEFISGLQTLSEGLVDGAFQSASQVITVSMLQPGAPAGRPSHLTWKAGPQTGLFQIDKGTIGYSAEDRDVSAVLDLPTPAGTNTLKATALFYQRQFEVPFVATGQAPRLGSLRIAFEDVVPTDETWSKVDPKAQLDRAPVDLLFDTKATLRVDRGAPGIPVEFSNVSLELFRLAALGGVVEAKGDIEILQPINLPLGEIKVDVSGAKAVISQLGAAGILDDSMQQSADAILQVYARPATDADRHETNIEFTSDGMLINGRTLDGRTPRARIELSPKKTDAGATTPEADADATKAEDGDKTPDAGAEETTPADGDETPENDASTNTNGSTNDESEPAAETDGAADDGTAPTTGSGDDAAPTPENASKSDASSTGTTDAETGDANTSDAETSNSDASDTDAPASDTPTDDGAAATTTDAETPKSTSPTNENGN